MFCHPNSVHLRHDPGQTRRALNHLNHLHHHHHQESTKVQGLTQQWSTQFPLSPAGAMFGARDNGEGAARRRRERRLRSWLRHERQSGRDGPVRSTRTTPQEDRGRTGDKCDAPRRQSPHHSQGSRPPCLGEPPGATGGGAAAPHGAHGGRLPLRADSRRSCAADGGPGYGCVLILGQPDGRAGYRRAQDLLSIVCCPYGSP